MYWYRLLWFMGAVVFFATQTLFAAEPQTSMVSFKSEAEKVSAFLAEPEGSGPFPAMIVIHEWWGLNERVKKVAKEFAGKGYVALAIDLYRGKVTSDPMEAHELFRGLPQDRALRDLKAAVDYLQDRANVKKDKIGSIGWCMGGGYSLLLAVNSPELAASVIYYGRLITDQEMLKKISAPIIGFFGEDDRGIPADSVKAFEQTAKDLGKKVKVHIYPQAGHAFALSGSPAYRETAANDAWQRTWEFLAAQL
jgi:carboxymethylenebutenolidase